MPTFCLREEFVNLFKQGLKSGEIDPFKMANMTSEDRNKFLSSYVGEENAKQVNALFESKLLLKSQVTGFQTWAKKVSGITPQTRSDIISRISKMDRVLNPESEKAFLKDLASTKLGTDVTKEEAQKIFELSKEATSAKNALFEDPHNKSKQIAYGNAKIKTLHYVNGLNPKKANMVVNLINLPRSLVTSLDFVSAPFRHGWGMSSTGAFWKNYANMPKYAFSEKAFNNRMAEISGSPYYDAAKRGKLSLFEMGDNLNQREEAFMSSILDHIPIVRGSQRAYLGFLNGLRMDSFEGLMRSAILKGENTTLGSKNVEDLANVVNNFTGAARLPRGLENSAAYINSVLFSPRKQLATLQMMNPINYVDPNISATARQAALRNLIGSVGLSAGVLVLAHMAGASVETDPRSTDFGQIRFGNTRIDVTGGNRTYATFLARMITGQTKSATTGITTTLGQGFPGTTRGQLGLSFIQNKLSPAASLIADWLSQTQQKPFNIPNEIMNRFIPLNINDSMALFNSDSSNAPIGTMLQLFGVPVTSYPTTTPTDWTTSGSKEIQTFQQHVGDTKFKQANQDYNTTLQQRTTQILQDSRYKGLSDTQKKSVLTKLKAKVQKDTFKKYHFTYHAKRSRKNQTINSLIQ